MAKIKKAIKKVKKTEPKFTGTLEDVAKIGLETVGLVKEVDAKVIALEQLIGTINKAVMAGSSIIAVEERIDRIVVALNQSKSTKGL